MIEKDYFFENDTLETQEKYTEDLLKGILSPFDNKTLSHVITTELLYNSIHHSASLDVSASNLFEDVVRKSVQVSKEYNLDYLQYPYKECYFSATLSGQIHIGKLMSEKGMIKEEALDYAQKILKDGLYEEKPSEERGFFSGDFHPASEQRHFLNEPYTEFTFLDFGIGIPNTLRELYRAYIKESDSESKEHLSPHHFRKRADGSYYYNEDSRVLEYAFLLDSSRKPFDEQLEVSSFIPRGLFFIIDIVRRYQGMLVARSYKGKVVYDFSKNSELEKAVIYSSRDSNLNVFPGTMVTIYIPAKINPIINAAKTDKRITHSDNGNVEEKHISISNLYFEKRREFRKREGREPTIFETYNLAFKELNESFKHLRSTKSIVYIDFAGITDYVLKPKIFYYLANNPRIDSDLNLIICNTTFSDSLKNVRDGIISNPIFMFRPIPCFALGNELIWIGIKNTSDESELTSLWEKHRPGIGQSSKIKDPLNLEGNFFNIQFSEQEFSISLTVKPLRETQQFIANIIPQKSIEYYLNDTSTVLLRSLESDPKKYAYRTSSGYYQNEFINWIEILYYPIVRRQLSHYLLTKFYWQNEDRNKNAYPQVDYIIAVTLSSQLLGKALRDFYIENKLQEIPPKLIRLADYYEYRKERAFIEVIKSKDKKILIINDVIATGKLVKRITDDLQERGDIKSIFALVDSSDESSGTKVDMSQEIVSKTVALYSFTEITRSKYPPKDRIIIPINPILNSPATLSRDRSETDKIIYPDSRDFLEQIPSEFLVLGHIERKPLHHNYYVLSEKLLKARGELFIQALLEKKADNERTREIVEKRPKHFDRIVKIQSAIQELKSNDSKAHSKVNNKIYNELEKNLEILSQSVNLKPKKYDYILYPIYSSAETISDEIYRRQFGNENLVVFPLPRIDTPKGWRFTFPPKFLNEETYDKNILLIDDGSATGDTLIQIIDSTCFLDVKSIDVINLIVRVEDFQREFFSRIRWMKVKTYRGKDTNETNRPNELFHGRNEGDVLKGDVIPVEVNFAVQLHLPYYKNSCPYCEEIVILKEQLLRGDTPKQVKDYIKKRLEEIELIDVEYNSNVPCMPNYMPFDSLAEEFTTTGTGNASNISKDHILRRIFELRDLIGKLDTYRLFMEDPLLLEAVDDLDIEYLFAIVLHEPFVINTLKYIGINIFNKISDKVVSIVEGKITPRFNWSRTSILRLLGLLDLENRFFVEKDKLNVILKYATSDKEGLDFVAYKLFSYIVSGNEVLHRRAELVIQAINKEHAESDSDTNYNHFHSLNIFCKEYVVYSMDQNVRSFQKLSHFYNSLGGQRPGHNLLKNPLERLKNLLKNAQSEQSSELVAVFLDDVLAIWQKNPDSIKSIISEYLIAWFKNLGPFLEEMSLKGYVFDHQNSIESLQNQITLEMENLNQDNLSSKTEILIPLLNQLIDVTCGKDSNLKNFFSEYPIKGNIMRNELIRIKDTLLSEKPSITCHIAPMSAEDCFVNIHLRSFQKVFENIFTNLKIHAPNSVASVKFLTDPYDLELKILIGQSEGYNPSAEKHGLEAINRILEYYNGKFIKLTACKANAVFTICLPIT